MASAAEAHRAPMLPPQERRMAFTSQMLGGVHFCIATLPQEWDDRIPYDGPLPDRPAA